MKPTPIRSFDPGRVGCTQYPGGECRRKEAAVVTELKESTSASVARR
jgi:hypothetical protein